jgi:hypothetical protein
MESLLELFVSVDDFCQAFLPNLQQYLLDSGAVKRRRARSLSVSEVMTILIYFHFLQMSLRYQQFNSWVERSVYATLSTIPSATNTQANSTTYSRATRSTATR